MIPVRGIAKSVVAACDKVRPAVGGHFSVRRVAAANALLTLVRLTHERPHFGIDSVESGGREVAVTEEIADGTPFCKLLHFKKDLAVTQPRVLVVAPMSGHFTTLLRGTVHTLLRDHDVYLTDWLNVRDVPLKHGRFDLDDFIEHLSRFLRFLGPRAHLLAVCQPTVAALAAVALMAADGDPAQPATMTLMAGPMDTRVNPDQGQRTCDQQADYVVRAQPDRYGPCPLCGMAAPRLSGVHPARCIHEHESGPACQGVRRSLPSPLQRRHRESRADRSPSTTSISR